MGVKAVVSEPTEELLRRFHAGERSSYDVLWRRYEARLLAFLRHHADAAFLARVGEDDLMQEVHLAALQGLAKFTYRRELSYFLWLCGIGRLLIANHCRRLKRAPPPARVRVAGASGSASVLSLIQSPERPIAERVEEVELLASALSGLGQRRRDAVILKYVEGLDGEEAARRMGVEPGAFRVLLARALVDLRAGVESLLAERS